MILIIILIVLCVIFLIALSKIKYSDLATELCSFGLVTSGVILFVLVFIAGIRHIPIIKENEKIKYTTKYQTITYTIKADESKVYLLANDIAEYNADVIRGRNTMHNPFVSALSYGFWDDLQLIDYALPAEE